MNTKIHRISRQLLTSHNLSDDTKLCKRFVTLLTQYCSSEINLLEVYRFLNRIKYDIQAHSKTHIESASPCDYLICIVEIEINIVNFKIKEPDLRIRIPKLQKWTDTHTALVEIIYGMHDMSVNRGKGRVDELTACFEFIFQVKLGNVNEKLGDIRIRRPKKFYIDKLKENLTKKWRCNIL